MGLDMSYTTDMWDKFQNGVLAMHFQGYKPFEIAQAVEISEELVKAILEKYASDSQSSFE